MSHNYYFDILLFDHIPASYRLYSVIPEFGEVIELSPDLTLDDPEKLYPYPLTVADDYYPVPPPTN